MTFLASCKKDVGKLSENALKFLDTIIATTMDFTNSQLPNGGIRLQIVIEIISGWHKTQVNIQSIELAELIKKKAKNVGVKHNSLGRELNRLESGQM